MAHVQYPVITHQASPPAVTYLPHTMQPTTRILRPYSPLNEFLSGIASHDAARAITASENLLSAAENLKSVQIPQNGSSALLAGMRSPFPAVNRNTLQATSVFAFTAPLLAANFRGELCSTFSPLFSCPRPFDTLPLDFSPLLILLSSPNLLPASCVYARYEMTCADFLMSCDVECQKQLGRDAELVKAIAQVMNNAQ
eukprot:2787146-Rhodomonas_salina.1